MSKTSSVGSSYRPHILNRSPIPYSDRSRSASYSEHSLPVQHNLGERTLDSKGNMDFGKFRRNSGPFKRALPHNSPPRRVNSHHARLPFKSRFDRDRDFRRRRVASPSGSNYRHSTTHNYRPVPKVDRIQRGRF
ncbi:hypothetical protein AHF37_12459 [Paragonimus kellicotti]|nr:hypothetical protein AHF37_12459 [Paragonimus kellicotti]